jgi:hypothetical protein
MNYNDEFSKCLATLDVAGARKLWRHVQPDLPQPKDDAETLIMLHMARTQSNSLAIKLRAYSHRWLLDHGYPSQLPEALKPKAEQMYSKIVGAVGVSINFTLPELKPAGKLIEKVMGDTVNELYADGEERPEIVRRIMFEAGQKERKKLLGKE